MYHYFHLKTTFRGYKKSQVDQCIKEKLSHNFTALSELSIKLIQLEGEKKQLEENTIKLRKELFDYLEQSLVNDAVNQIKTELNTLYGRVDDLSSMLDQIVIIQGSNIAQKETATMKEATLIEEAAIMKESTQINKAAIIKETTTNEDAVKFEEAPQLQQLPRLQSIPVSSSLESLPKEVQIAATIDHGKVEIIDFKKDTAISKKPDPEINPSEKGKLLNFTRTHQALEHVSVENNEQEDQVNSFWGLAVNCFPKIDSLDKR